MILLSVTVVILLCLRDVKIINSTFMMFQAYAMNGDQLLGGKTARSYASMMDKARYLQKDIEVEIR